MRAMQRMLKDSVNTPLIRQSSQVLPDPGGHHAGLSGTRTHESIDVGPCSVRRRCAGRADEKIALLGAMQSLFEGSMYTFVFLWTPALSPRGERLPHGMIFACFMVASMAGAPPSRRHSRFPTRLGGCPREDVIHQYTRPHGWGTVCVSLTSISFCA